MSNATGPIADLSYRTYEGPLDPPTQRWKVIAKSMIMKTVKNKWYWVLMGLGGWYFWIMMIVLLVLDMMLSGTGNDSQQALQQLGAMNWTGHFLHGYSYGQLIFMFIALSVGAGTIANDNRANALLVYLSKPCTKKDYVIGKWVGVFVPVAFAMLVPTAFFYFYGAMNYRGFGFISDDPWLFLRMIAIIGFGASLHASLVLGVSSLFNQGRIASATYVGFYFITTIVTFFIKIILIESRHEESGMRRLAEGLFYASIDGLNIGIAKVFLDIDGADLFVGARDIMIDRPTPLIAIAAVLVVSALALRLVWRRVRAVEVVG